MRCIGYGDLLDHHDVLGLRLCDIRNRTSLRRFVGDLWVGAWGRG